MSSISLTNSCALRYTWCQSFSRINDIPIGFLPFHPCRPYHPCFPSCLPEAGLSFFPDFDLSVSGLPELGLLYLSLPSLPSLPCDFFFSCDFFFFSYDFSFFSCNFFDKVFLFLASARMALVVLLTTRSMARAALLVWTNHLPAALVAQVRTILMAILRQLFSYSFQSSNSVLRKQASSNSFCFIRQYLCSSFVRSALLARCVRTPRKILSQQACFFFKRSSRSFLSPSSYCLASSYSFCCFCAIISLRTSDQNLGVLKVQVRMVWPQQSLMRGSEPFFSSTMQMSSWPHAAAQNNNVCCPTSSQWFSRSTGMVNLRIKATWQFLTAEYSGVWPSLSRWCRAPLSCVRMKARHLGSPN